MESEYSLNLFHISKSPQMFFPGSQFWCTLESPFFPTVILKLGVTMFLNTFTFLLPCLNNCAFVITFVQILFHRPIFTQISSIMTAATVHKQNSPLPVTRSSTLTCFKYRESIGQASGVVLVAASGCISSAILRIIKLNFQL